MSTTAVSRWLVSPTATRSEAVRFALLRAPSTTSVVRCQISLASCSTRITVTRHREHERAKVPEARPVTTPVNQPSIQTEGEENHGESASHGARDYPWNIAIVTTAGCAARAIVAGIGVLSYQLAFRYLTQIDYTTLINWELRPAVMASCGATGCSSGARSPWSRNGGATGRPVR